MSWLATVLLAFLAALVANWAGKEAESWTPKLIRVFLGRAVSRLPERRRARLNEEWHASLTELPTPLSQLVFVIGVGVAAERIRRRDGGRRRLGLPSFGRGSVRIVGGTAGAVIGSSRALHAKGVAYLFAICAVFVGFYLVALSVDRTRREVKALETSIADARKEISGLEARLAQRTSMERAPLGGATR